MKLSAQNIAFNETARQAIMADPNFHGGRYLAHNTHPKSGLAVARMIGHITYLSDHAMGEKFGRELRSGSFTPGNDEPVEFQVEDRKSTRLNSSHVAISYAVFCLKKKK